MMKPNAPYSSARRAQNQQVADNTLGQLKYLMTGKGRSEGSSSLSPSQSKANKAADVLRDSGPVGTAAVNNTRKARNRTEDYLRNMGE